MNQNTVYCFKPDDGIAVPHEISLRLCSLYVSNKMKENHITYSQGPRHTKDIIKMVPVVPLFSTEHSKGKILALKIWDRKSFEVGGQWPL